MRVVTASFAALGFVPMLLFASLKKEIGASDQCLFKGHGLGALSSLPS